MNHTLRPYTGPGCYLHILDKLIIGAAALVIIMLIIACVVTLANYY